MKTIIAVGVGALAMYLLDREQGAQRRAQLRAQLERAKRMLKERVPGNLSTQLEPDRPSETPEGAHHLGR